MGLALFLCISFMTSRTTDAAYRTFCEAPTVKASESATLTFFFPEDVQEKRDSFCVYRTDSTGENKDTPVACTWLEDGTTYCSLKDGVHLLSKTVKYELLVQFDHVQNGTRFSCDTVTSRDDHEVDECTVFVEDESDVVVTEKTANQSSGKKDPVLTGSVPEAGAGNQGVSPFLIASIVANVIFVVFIVVAAAVLIRKRRSTKKEPPPTSASSAPFLEDP